jgi:hypothetical protein
MSRYDCNTTQSSQRNKAYDSVHCEEDIGGAAVNFTLPNIKKICLLTQQINGSALHLSQGYHWEKFNLTLSYLAVVCYVMIA